MPGLHPVIAITGATGAIGSATASVLVRRGARLVLLARPSERIESLVARLGGQDRRVSSVAVDLSAMSSVRRAAREITQTVDRIDALVHTAAIFSSRYRTTAEGFELMLATNHLAPFLLTNLLRDRLANGGQVIIVTAPSSTRVNIDRLLVADQFRALRTFGATKAANLLFTFELARRASRWDVRANAYHPGLVRSRLMREAPRALRWLSRMASRAPDRAAADLAELATSPAFEGTTGYLLKGARRIDAPRSTLDIDAQRALWTRTAELLDMNGQGF